MDYIVSASDLYRIAKQIINDGMDWVEVSLLEPDNTIPSDPLPPGLGFRAWKNAEEFGVIYGAIDVRK